MHTNARTHNVLLLFFLSETFLSVMDDFGFPLNLGVRLSPKLASTSSNEFDRFGVTVYLYARLWLYNLTGMPLCFGCMSSDMKSLGKGPSLLELVSTSPEQRAEAAISELAAIFDDGGLNDVKMLSNMPDPWTNTASHRDLKMQHLPFQSVESICCDFIETTEFNGDVAKRSRWLPAITDSVVPGRLPDPPHEPYWDWSERTWVSISTDVVSSSLSLDYVGPSLID